MLSSFALTRCAGSYARHASRCCRRFCYAIDRVVDRSFPNGRPALIAMVKEDCPTCGIVMPLLEAFHRALWRDALDVLVVGQTQDGNATADRSSRS